MRYLFLIFIAGCGPELESEPPPPPPLSCDGEELVNEETLTAIGECTEARHSENIWARTTGEAQCRCCDGECIWIQLPCEQNWLPSQRCG